MSKNEVPTPRRADQITVEQAYIAMFLFLDAFFERGQRRPFDITLLVSWANPFASQSANPEELPTADPAFWYDWLASVSRVLKGDYDPSNYAGRHQPPPHG